MPPDLTKSPFFRPSYRRKQQQYRTTTTTTPRRRKLVVNTTTNETTSTTEEHKSTIEGCTANIINAIVGAGPPIAAGAALTAKTLKNGCVSVAFIGDGASDQGTVAEALNLAVVLNLPMIFMYENNYYAEFTKNPKIAKISLGVLSFNFHINFIGFGSEF